MVNMLKRILIIFTASALMINADAFGVSKIVVGSKCSKSGLVSTYMGKQYVCLIKNGKLVWNLKPTSSNSTKTPVRESKSSSNQINSISDLITNLDLIQKTAWQKSISESSQNVTPKFEYEVIVGPNTKPYILNSAYSKYTIKDYLDLVVKLYSKTPPKRPTILVYGNWYDREWMTSKLNELCGPNRTCSSDFLRDCDSGNQVCGGSFATSDNNWKNEILVIASTETPWKIYTENIGTTEVHEFTHSVQHSLTPSDAPNRMNVIPRWYVEGQANLNQLIYSGYYNNIGRYNTTDIKQVAPSFSFQEFDVNMQAQIAMMKNTPTDNQFFLDFLNADNSVLYSGTTYSQKQVYFYGAVIMQNLRAVKGPQAEMDLISLVAKGSSFEDAFNLVFNLDWSKAKLVLAEVLAKQFAF